MNLIFEIGFCVANSQTEVLFGNKLYWKCKSALEAKKERKSMLSK